MLSQFQDHVGDSSKVKTRTIYIVIDRLDCCARQHHHLRGVMEGLSGIVTRLQGSHLVNVKVAVIAETSEGNAEWHSEWLSSCSFDLRRLVVRHDWDQEKLPSWMRLNYGSRPLIWGGSSRRGPGQQRPLSLLSF